MIAEKYENKLPKLRAFEQTNAEILVNYYINAISYILVKPMTLKD